MLQPNTTPEQTGAIQCTFPRLDQANQKQLIGNRAAAIMDKGILPSGHGEPLPCLVESFRNKRFA